MVFAKMKWGQVCTPSCTVVAPSRCPTTVGILGILWYSINTEHVTMNKWINKLSLENKRSRIFSRNMLFRLEVFKPLVVVVSGKNLSSGKIIRKKVNTENKTNGAASIRAGLRVCGRLTQVHLLPSLHASSPLPWDSKKCSLKP